MDSFVSELFFPPVHRSKNRKTRDKGTVNVIVACFIFSIPLDTK